MKTYIMEAKHYTKLIIIWCKSDVGECFEILTGLLYLIDYLRSTKILHCSHSTSPI